MNNPTFDEYFDALASASKDDGYAHSALWTSYKARQGTSRPSDNEDTIVSPDRVLADARYAIRCLKLTVFILTVFVVLLALSVVELSAKLDVERRSHVPTIGRTIDNAPLPITDHDDSLDYTSI